MADWPEAAELAQVLNIDNVDDWDTTLDRTLESAIARVKGDIGAWDDDVDEPSPNQAQAALRMAELMATRPTEPESSLSADPTYRTLMKGSRRVFGFA